jgi:DNA-binding IclR family transcriptional regulator
MPKASDTSSVQKVCRILRALSVPEALRLADVAAATGLNKATVLRLLESLADEGFVERDEDSKRYRLGEHALLRGLASPGRAHLRDRARPWLMRLATLCGDTVLLARVTARGVHELGLHVGMQVWAQVKSVALVK